MTRLDTKLITLATLAEATEQQVFDQVVGHLLWQQQMSADEGGDACLYRGVNGLQCAAGCLIGDDEYTPELEGSSWKHLTNNGVVPGAHRKLIADLQRVHDCYPVEKWAEHLKHVAGYSGLEWKF